MTPEINDLCTKIFTVIRLLLGSLFLTGVVLPPPGWTLDVKLSPAPGHYPDPIQLTFSVPEDTRVFYTVDGTEPGTDSAEYVGAISLEQDTVIRYVTVDPDDLSDVGDCFRVRKGTPDLETCWFLENFDLVLEFNSFFNNFLFSIIIIAIKFFLNKFI